MPSASHQQLIFISYRRADADALAGRLRDRLAAALPDWHAFMDVNSINAGDDFKQVIDDKLAQSPLMLAVIGPRWAGENGSRLADADDLVRYEVSKALALKLRVIPVLVNSASMPSARELPADIKVLAKLNAIELRHTRFDDDFANLVRAISGAPAPAPARKSVGYVRAIATAITAGLAGLFVAIVALAIHYQTTGRQLGVSIGFDGVMMLVSACVLLSGLCGFWLYSRRR